MARVRPLFRLRKLLVQSCDLLKARRAFVRYSPLMEQDVALGANIWIYHVVAGEYSQTLKEGLIGKCTLEAATSILDQAVENRESAQLTMHVSILAMR